MRHFCGEQDRDTGGIVIPLPASFPSGDFRLISMCLCLSPSGPIARISYNLDFPCPSISCVMPCPPSVVSSYSKILESLSIEKGAAGCHLFKARREAYN
jgi:hypothetical protein